jgi:LacI family transcriptional regulator
MLKISDIAQHVGVSATTVSYVLNDGEGAGRISEKTRNKVLQAAEELGYRSNNLARAMRTGDTKMLGVLGGKTVEEHVGKMLEGALEAADAHGHTLKLLRLHAIGNSAQQAIRRSSELRLTGILALHLPEETLEDLHIEAEKYNTPLVVMDTHCLNPNIYQVISDDAGGFIQGVDHLVKLGHKKIALMKGGGTTTIGTSRKRAFQDALNRHGLSMPDSFCLEGSFRLCAPSVAAARSILSLPVEQRPTAIFCSSDLMALATLKVAHELKINVPTELSIIGFSNMTATQYAAPALTTIDQPFVEIGYTAVETLLDIIAEKTHDSNGSILTPSKLLKGTSEARNIIKTLPTHLIVRDSTAPPLL